MAETLFECDQCGACCRKLIVEIVEADVVREPRLREVARPIRKAAYVMFGDEEPPDYMLTCGKPCPMLNGNQCSIHDTKPHVCAAFSAGSEQCQDARAADGLPPLVPLATRAVLGAER